jgi:hypothetical protein
MGVFSKSKSQDESPVVITSPSSNSKVKPRQGRERLLHFVDQIEAATIVVSELSEHITRLQAVIIEADAASRKLQDAISADGGLALAAYSSGTAKSDDPIARLVIHSRESGDASLAAKVALPHTETLLANAKAQLISLNDQRHEEVGRVIANLAGIEVRAYETAFEEVCRCHDSLVGFARVGQSNIGDVYKIEESPRMPRFVANGDSTSDPFIRHRLDDRVASASAERWQRIRAALESSPNVDLSELT